MEPNGTDSATEGDRTVSATCGDSIELINVGCGDKTSTHVDV